MHGVKPACAHHCLLLAQVTGEVGSTCLALMESGRVGGGILGPAHSWVGAQLRAKEHEQAADPLVAGSCTEAAAPSRGWLSGVAGAASAAARGRANVQQLLEQRQLGGLSWQAVSVFVALLLVLLAFLKG